MAYPRRLDEVPEGTLRQELDKRARMRMEGRCDYCGRPAGTAPPCGQPSRHFGGGRPKRRKQAVEVREVRRRVDD